MSEAIGVKQAPDGSIVSRAKHAKHKERVFCWAASGVFHAKDLFRARNNPARRLGGLALPFPACKGGR